MSKSIQLSKFLGSIRQKDYTLVKVYSQGPEVRFLQLHSPSQRKKFLLQIPSAINVYTTETDHLIDLADNDYRSIRQREYLAKIALKSVACLSSANICVKNDHLFQCYLIDSIPQVSLSESDSDEENEDRSSSGSDIELDDYPVTEILPVFNLLEFVRNLDNFEKDNLLPGYTEIIDAEERNNEEQVEQLLAQFDQQKETIKERIFQLHKENYHIHRDIEKAGLNLQRIYEIKKKATNEKDRVRFKIERLTLEAEETIDVLNQRLGEQRNKANALLSKYWECLQAFKQFDV